MCGSIVDIQSPTAEIRRGKKKKKKEEEATTGQNYNVRICYTQGGHKQLTTCPCIRCGDIAYEELQQYQKQSRLLEQSRCPRVKKATAVIH